MKKHQPTPEPRIIKWFFAFIIGFATLLLGWITLLFANYGINIQPFLLLIPVFTLCILIGVLLYHQNYLKIICHFRKKYPRLNLTVLLKWLLVASVVFGIIIRLAFVVFSDTHNPTPQLGDSGIHWHTAAKIVNGEELTAYEGQYEAFYPHLMTYTGTLAIFMKIFGVNYFAVLISNLLFDLIGVIAFYLLLRRWRGRNAANLGAIVWLLNPLEIMYCATSMPIVITNMFLVIALLLGFLAISFFQKKEWHFFALTSASLGLCLSVGNGFRPFFTVLLIALVLVLICLVIRQGKSFILPALAGLFLTTLVFVGNNKILDLGYQSMNPYHVPGGVGIGWNIFVGANYDSWGRWNAEDYNWWRSQIYGNSCTHFEEFQYDTYDCIEVHEDLAGLQSELLRMAIDRYKQMSPAMLLRHLLHKTTVLFVDTSAPIVWLVETIHIDNEDPYYRAAQTVGTIMLITSVILSLVFFMQLFWRQKLQFDPFILFFTLCFCGLVAVSLLVEVMHRYIMPISIFFLLFSVCQLANLNYKQLLAQRRSEKCRK